MVSERKAHIEFCDRFGLAHPSMADAAGTHEVESEEVVFF
jgi:hypothetical protein